MCYVQRIRLKCTWHRFCQFNLFITWTFRFKSTTSAITLFVFFFMQGTFKVFFYKAPFVVFLKYQFFSWNKKKLAIILNLNSNRKKCVFSDFCTVVLLAENLLLVNWLTLSQKRSDWNPYLPHACFVWHFDITRSLMSGTRYLFFFKASRTPVVDIKLSLKVANLINGIPTSFSAIN